MNDYRDADVKSAVFLWFHLLRKMSYLHTSYIMSPSGTQTMWCSCHGEYLESYGRYL
jgi:hypothetical protein